MKRFATRGLLIIMLIVICSMFFAQTIVTITTPKIKIVSSKRGRFEEKISLAGRVSFQHTVEYTPSEMQSVAVAVDGVFVRVGDWVNEGDLIAETTPPLELEVRISESRNKLLVAQGEYRKNEMENAKIALNTDSDKNNAIRSAEDAWISLMDAQEALIAKAAAKGISLGTDTTMWATIIQDNLYTELVSYMQDVINAQSFVNTAEEQVVTLFSKSRTKKELVDYIEGRVRLRREVEKEEKNLVLLLAQYEQCKFVHTPHSGYIIEINLEEGKIYNASTSAFVISTDSEPVIKCDVSSITHRLEAGLNAEIQSSLGAIPSQVYAVENSGFQKKDLFITLDKTALSSLGGLYDLLNSNAQITVIVHYKAKQAATLLSASAVRTEDKNKSFIYIVEEGDGFFGPTLVLRKKTVTVLERGEMDISLEEDLSGVRVADKEDRSIENNMTVMEYVN